MGIIVLACPAQVVQIGGILPGFFCDGYIAFRLGIGDLHIICEQKLCKQPGSQHLLRVILLEQAHAGTLRDHFGMLRVILGHGVYDGLKADDRVFADVQQGSVAAHPGGTRGGINGENALAGVQKIGGIAGDLEGGERAGGSVLGNGFQQLSGLSVPQLHRAVAPGIGGVQLGKALNHHIIRGLVDEGNQYLLAVELVCPVGIFRRSGLTDLPDEVPGQGFRQGEAQLLHKVFVDVAGLCGAHIGQGVGGSVDGTLGKKLGNDLAARGGVKGQSAAAQTVVGVVHQAVQRNHCVLTGQVGGNVVRVGDADIRRGAGGDVGDDVVVDPGVVGVQPDIHGDIGVELLKVPDGFLIDGGLHLVGVVFGPEGDLIVPGGIEALRQGVLPGTLPGVRHQMAMAAGEQKGKKQHQGKCFFHPLVPPLATPAMIFFRKIRNRTISGREITVTAAIMAGMFSRPKPFSRIS